MQITGPHPAAPIMISMRIHRARLAKGAIGERGRINLHILDGWCLHLAQRAHKLCVPGGSSGSVLDSGSTRTNILCRCSLFGRGKRGRQVGGNRVLGIVKRLEERASCCANALRHLRAPCIYTRLHARHVRTHARTHKHGYMNS